MTLYELKEQQKELAKEIRQLKNKRKESPYGRVPGLEGKRSTYRYNHVAYCLARGRKYEEIERNPRDPVWLSADSQIVKDLQEATFGKKEEVVNG
jgi:hypothetical protein